jgi:hypothetical protein
MYLRNGKESRRFIAKKGAGGTRPERSILWEKRSRVDQAKRIHLEMLVRVNPRMKFIAKTIVFPGPGFCPGASSLCSCPMRGAPDHPYGRLAVPPAPREGVAKACPRLSGPRTRAFSGRRTRDPVYPFHFHSRDTFCPRSKALPGLNSGGSDLVGQLQVRGYEFLYGTVKVTVPSPTLLVTLS